MAIEIYELAPLRGAVDPAGGTREVPWQVTGTEDDAAVEAAVRANVPATYAGLVYKDFSYDHQGAGVWTVLVRYGPAPPVTLTFDTTGGTQHITQSLETVERYVRSVASGSGSGATTPAGSTVTDPVSGLKFVLPSVLEMTSSADVTVTATNNPLYTYVIQAVTDYPLTLFNGQWVSGGPAGSPDYIFSASVKSNGDVTVKFVPLNRGVGGVYYPTLTFAGTITGAFPSLLVNLVCTDVNVAATVSLTGLTTGPLDTGGGSGSGSGPAAVAAPDFNGAIGVHDGNVEGCDITVPVFAFTIARKVKRDVLPYDYGLKLFRLTAKTNRDLFAVSYNGLLFVFGPGECLFQGGTGQGDGEDGWEFNLKFAASPSKADLKIGDIGPVRKEGWHYLWVLYEDGTDPTALVKRPRAVYVERVYDHGDFGDLGL